MLTESQKTSLEELVEGTIEWTGSFGSRGRANGGYTLRKTPKGIKAAFGHPAFKREELGTHPTREEAIAACEEHHKKFSRNTSWAHNPA